MRTSYVPTLSLDHADCVLCVGDRNGVDFIGNKQTKSLTNLQTLNFITDSNTVSQITYQFLIIKHYAACDTVISNQAQLKYTMN